MSTTSLARTARAAAGGALEASVVGSFTRLGPAVRRRLWAWEPLGAHRLDGRVAVVTGATSGLGRATAGALAALGAELVLVVRDRGRGERTAAEIEREAQVPVAVVVADMGDLAAVRAAAATLARWPRLDILVHNAGMLNAGWTTTRDGLEATVAVHVLGPFLLTALCRPMLAAAAPSRVIVVTSGGMYTQPVDVAYLDPSAGGYDGVVAYARAKRIQVALVEECAPDLAASGIALSAMHPGWADTPGLHTSLPRFGRVVGPLLRTAAQGADTAAWLASAPAELVGSGQLWLDRMPRRRHRRPGTARTDTAEARRRLVRRCCELVGVDGSTADRVGV